MVAWYLCFDSLLAFKGSIVTAVGIYFMSFLNLIYKDGRPFWNNSEIKSENHCVFSFASPSTTCFIVFFFNFYMLIMGRYKYAGEVSQTVNVLLIALILVLNILVYFSGVLNGLTYIYQSVMGTLSAFVYLVLCLTFDKEIHRWCEKTGFILQSSRLRKFQTFFGCIIAFTFYSLLYLSFKDEWDMPQNWIINASFNQKKCVEIFNQRANNRLGINQTFDETAILFFLIGMVFGQSYSLNYVRPLLWVHSELWRKVIRLILGCLISIAVVYFFYYTVRRTND